MTFTFYDPCDHTLRTNRGDHIEKKRKEKENKSLLYVLLYCSLQARVAYLKSHHLISHHNTTEQNHEILNTPGPWTLDPSRRT